MTRYDLLAIAKTAKDSIDTIVETNSLRELSGAYNRLLDSAKRIFSESAKRIEEDNEPYLK